MDAAGGAAIAGMLQNAAAAMAAARNFFTDPPRDSSNSRSLWEGTNAAKRQNYFVRLWWFVCFPGNIEEMGYLAVLKRCQDLHTFSHAF